MRDILEKVLITGSFGFIGLGLCKKFENLGYHVWKTDCIYAEDEQYLQINMCYEKEKLKDYLALIKPDMVVHCAGSADVAKSIQKPEEDFERNVKSCHNLLFALNELKMINVRVIVLSSAAVYGQPQLLPISESCERNPLSPYALHKAMVEDTCFYFSKRYHFDLKILRIFSAYGPGLKKQIFWDMYNKYQQHHELHMLGSGLESRDYIYIDDLLQAIYLVSTKAPQNELIYNIGNGQEILIKEVAEFFMNAVGEDEKKIFFDQARREGDPINWKADISKIQKLGYTQTVSIKEGINNYVRWCEEKAK